MSSHVHLPRPVVPLIIGCHHKTGTCLLIQLLNKLGPRLIQKGRLGNIIMGNPIDRKLPLSSILNRNRCGCYVNMWFEHEIDVPPDNIRFLHFVRHPTKWVRSAYLYHKKGAPSDLIRWLDWKVFCFNGAAASYFEVLNQVDSRLGLAIESVRSFPEIVGTACSARSSSSLVHCQRISLEQVHRDFGAAMAGLCSFLGFGQSEIAGIVAQLKHLDLSDSPPGSLPPNVTRRSANSAELEQTLGEDPQFAKLYAGAARDMGFHLAEPQSGSNSILPEGIVNALLEGISQVLLSWQTVERSDKFMREETTGQWWTSYALQVFGCGHLMMQGFIQRILEEFQLGRAHNHQIREKPEILSG